MSSLHNIASHSWSTTWKKAVISLPRLVPNAALRITSPDGPQPLTIKLPSRDPGKHEIPIYVFVYVPPPELRPSPASSHGHATQVQGQHSSNHTASKSTLVATTTSGTMVHALNLPVLIDFHGGSFILGTPQEQAPFCSYMARSLGSTLPGGGCVVISVDYRLGPYAQYPAANTDSEDVVNAVLRESSEGGNMLREAVRAEVSKLGREEWVNLDKTRVALSGFSSGGNLALTLVMSSLSDPTIGRDWPSVFPDSFPNDVPVVLFYPSLDSRLLPDERPRPPGLDPPAGFFTRYKVESELMPKYLPPHQRHHPRASPGLGPVGDGGLHSKAKIMLVLPELDSLSDQSMTWVKKVEDDRRGGDLEVVPVKGMFHGWTQYPDGFLKTDDERRLKMEVFAGAKDFVWRIWAGEGTDQDEKAVS